ncbi:MAG: glycosyltransferase family 9 protein [Bacteroidetes bacterium]|nr:glycosyltransferase family 9 protein [Bacteroidota bacterium]
MKKILIIRFSSLGDIILSFPLINALNKEYPDAEIHYLTKSAYKPILELNPLISKIILFDGQPLSDLKAEIKSGGYDLVLDIHKNFRSILLTLFSGLNVERYKKETMKKFLLVKFKINLFKEIIPVYLKYIKALGNSFASKYSEYTSSELKFDREKKYEFDYVVIAPSSKHFTKTYPKEKFVELIKKFNYKVILVGDESDKDKSICSYIAKETAAINLCGKLSYPELANVIYNSEFVITNDSAILHISEMLGKKVRAIFGSTVKEFGFFPQLKESAVFENENLKCRPCTHIGLPSCPLGHFKCMNEIRIEKLN